MKNIIPSLFLGVFLILSCKTDKKKETLATTTEEITIPQKIAKAHGYEHWKNVSEIKFTFNVDRPDGHFDRTWIWRPKTKEITAITKMDTLTYNRSDMDSIAVKTDTGFINDKYWLLAPFNLIWDQQNFKYDYIEESEAPLSGKKMHKLTIVYNNEGGYTPGDAYDFFFGDDYILKEWIYRKGNRESPSLSTTWEDYADKGGIEIATSHKDVSGDFKLSFTDIEVKFE